MAKAKAKAKPKKTASSKAPTSSMDLDDPMVVLDIDDSDGDLDEVDPDTQDLTAMDEELAGGLDLGDEDEGESGPVVGGEVDAYCFHCKRMALHTVVSMLRGRPAKVLCNCCDIQHQFRAKAPGGRRDAKTKNLPKSRAVWEEALSKADATHVRGYVPTLTFQVDEVIDHPHFGKGLVVRVYDATKMEVLFEDMVRRLVHGRA